MVVNALEEYVMVFPSVLLDRLGYFQGLSFVFDRYLNAIEKNHRFMRRRDVETDPRYKQLIPYAIIIYGKKILRYRRGNLLSENRLVDNYSIGFGGHISVRDPNLFSSTYHKGMRREIAEELSIYTEYQDRVVALINDDSNEVGRVHFGVVHLLELLEPSVTKKEKSINDPRFVSIQGLTSNIVKYENWSKICIKNIERILPV